MGSVSVIPLEVDLADFSAWLRLQGVNHRIVEVNGGQTLLLQDERYQEQVAAALSRYLQDGAFQEHISHEAHRMKELASKRKRFSRGAELALYPRANPQQAPVIFVLIAVSVLVAFLTNFGQGGVVLRAMLIIDPFLITEDLSSISGRWSALLDMLATGQVWRVVSPDFLHFNVMHITFNLLMLWVLGGQLEIQKGSGSFIALVLFVSIIANIAQLLETTYLFGGLSGVVYGLVGYCWLWSYFDKGIFFPKILLKFSLFWLLLGYTPLTEWLGMGKMANAAHLYGLIAGGVWAGITLYVNEVLLKRSRS